MKNELFLSELLLTVLLLFVHFIVAVALKLCAGNVLCYLEDARDGYEVIVLCFDAVGWVAGRASGL